jgi:acetylxylan esterase
MAKMVNMGSLLYILSIISFVLNFVRAIPEPQANVPVGGNPTQNTSSSTACADVHLIVVRASSEKPGQGVIGTL